MNQSQNYMLFSVLSIYSMKITFNRIVRLLLSRSARADLQKEKLGTLWEYRPV